MAYTLEQLAAACQRALRENPGPTGRQQVAALIQDVLTDDSFLAEHVGDDVPERKILYEDAELGFCILAHVHHGPKESQPHDHGPSWAIYGQARGETVMSDWTLVEPAAENKPGKVRRPAQLHPQTRNGSRVQRGRPPFPAPRRADSAHQGRGTEHGEGSASVLSSGVKTQRSTSLPSRPS